jgi:hypothetical protein
VELRIDGADDDALETREAVVPFPPGLRLAARAPCLAFFARIDVGIEGHVEQVLRADIGATDVSHAAVDHDQLAVVHVQNVHLDRVADLRGE